MKKYISVTAVLFIAAAMLAGCADAASASQLTRGTFEDKVYTSEYAGLKFTAPEGWVYSTDGELAGMMGVGVDAYKDADMNFSEEMIAKRIIYDMIVADSSTGSNVIVLYENLAMSDGGTKLTEEQYLGRLQSTEKQAMIMDIEFGEITEEKLGSKSFKILPAAIPEADAMRFYCVGRVDNYMVNIMVTAFGGDDINKIMANFS